jgi:hypothetical protein
MKNNLGALVALMAVVGKVAEDEGTIDRALARLQALQ